MQAGYPFLYDNAQSIIRNEAAAALGYRTDSLRPRMLKHPEVQYWIERLEQFAQRRQAHGSADYCLENSMHKLYSFGIRAEDDFRISQTNRFIVDYIQSKARSDDFLDSIHSTITASWLAAMGHDEEVVVDILRERVEAVFSFVKSRDYNIYVDPDGYPSIPAARRMHPLVNPDLYEGNIWRLPTVHDLFAYANLPGVLRKDVAIGQMIDTIIEYIMDERYQRFHRGFGLMLIPPRAYCSMGWSVHLHDFIENGYFQVESLLWSMELLSHFEKARNCKWFLDNLRLLKEFETDGIYEFPAIYVKEGKDKYYVNGGHMGLGEDRKTLMGRKIESTAWMLRILRNCGCEP